MYIGIQCHVSVTWLHVFVTPISKHLASQYRWQSRDFNRRLETCEEEETCVAGAIPKCTRYKNKWAAGIFDNLQRADFLKLQRCNRVVSLIRGLTKTTTARATGTSKQAIGLISKITTPHVHYFLQISLPFLHNYDVK